MLVNANGDVEPCVFVHSAVAKIDEKSLRKVLNSRFSRAPGQAPVVERFSHIFQKIGSSVGSPQVSSRSRVSA